MATYGDPSTEKAMAAFHKAAKAIQGKIRKLGHGQLGESAREGARQVFAAINKLDDRANKPEIRGDHSASELAYQVSKALRRETVVAEELGFEKVRKAREDESYRLRQEIKTSKPRPGTYEHELALLRSMGIKK